MVVDQGKVFKLVKQSKIGSSLKTYADTILFYYLGYLSATKNNGNLSEIGVGGSTYVLLELSEILQNNFYIFDIDKPSTEQFIKSEFWLNSKPKVYIDDSVNLHSYENLPTFSYCHIDGSKNYNTTVSDINFYLSHLSHNGIICQDDYGNSKWPTVTDAVKFLESTNQIKTILVGDSSIWFTKPEYYEFWMNLLETDYEFSLLKFLCNIVSSELLGKTPKYLFLQSLFNKQSLDTYSAEEKKYFKNILDTETTGYLQMPYTLQSRIGNSLYENVIVYKLSQIYNTLRGDSWPQSIPSTKEDIDNLPEWVKDELITLHGIDLYAGISIETQKEY